MPFLSINRAVSVTIDTSLLLRLLPATSLVSLTSRWSSPSLCSWWPRPWPMPYVSLHCPQILSKLVHPVKRKVACKKQLIVNFTIVPSYYSTSNVTTLYYLFLSYPMKIHRLSSFEVSILFTYSTRLWVWRLDRVWRRHGIRVWPGWLW